MKQWEWGRIRGWGPWTFFKLFLAERFLKSKNSSILHSKNHLLVPLCHFLLGASAFCNKESATSRLTLFIPLPPRLIISKQSLWVSNPGDPLRSDDTWSPSSGVLSFRPFLTADPSMLAPQVRSLAEAAPSALPQSPAGCPWCSGPARGLCCKLLTLVTLVTLD